MTVKNAEFWLNEAELKTPIHDKMVLWTFKKCETLLEDLNIFPNFKKDEKADMILEGKVFNKFGIYPEKIMEKPIRGYNGFNLGFIDLFYSADIKNGEWLDGRNHYEQDSNLFTVGFEIKPEVKSIGEVLRQFQYYKSNLKMNYLILVTKTTGLKEIFESQGFKVIEYKEEENGTIK
jgi:hypothetical protein